MVRAAGARSFLELRSRVINRLKLHDHRFCRRPRGSDFSATEVVLLPTFPQHISCNTGETSPHPEARGAREFQRPICRNTELHDVGQMLSHLADERRLIGCIKSGTGSVCVWHCQSLY